MSSSVLYSYYVLQFTSLSVLLAVAQEAMDSMMESSMAWVCHYESDLDESDGDQSKIAECAESFVTLLSAITGIISGSPTG